MNDDFDFIRGIINVLAFTECRVEKPKRKFTVDDLKTQTAGVECRKDADVIDEIPGAYKDIEQVMQNQSDLVEIVAELRQILCVKG